MHLAFSVSPPPALSCSFFFVLLFRCFGRACVLVLVLPRASDVPRVRGYTALVILLIRVVSSTVEITGEHIIYIYIYITEIRTKIGCVNMSGYLYLVLGSMPNCHTIRFLHVEVS